jgi:hypothetical protein
MREVYINGIGLLAPGLAGWRDSMTVLNGTAAYRRGDIPELRSSLLSANERRRTTATIKLALQVAQEADEQASEQMGGGTAQAWSVFTSSEGDGKIIHKVCTALAMPERPVSPTLFHNSVHNAPAGYWSIATGCALPSASICAYEGSFSAGLLEAANIVLVEQASVLLVAYEYPPPSPLCETLHVSEPFAAALWLAGHRTASSRASLELSMAENVEEDRLDDAELERMRTSSPAARSLPLLCAIARGRTRDVILPYLQHARLAVQVRP